MSSRLQKLVYRAMSPMHIGWHTLGYVNLTRYYIPGKNIWAAFTGLLARANPLGRKIGADANDFYKGYGEIVKNNIVASYFYPASEASSPLVPRFTKKGLVYGMDEMPRAEFERLFIKSSGQTAILPGSNTAEDESLHESEFISPFSTEGNPVYFTGYVFVNEDSLGLAWDGIKDIIKEIFVGGDRKYGWGRLVLEDVCEPSDFFGFYIKPGSKEITIGTGGHIPAHLPVSAGLKLKGDIEPLVGREWGADREGKRGAGKKVTGSTVYWVPGSILLDEHPLSIGEYGRLQI